mmetsp:Transcript_9120/g.21862  ORF Transcript_9120/g.21862 Transcript_9120/m.21862 type:complete len:262 (-) Transcript_9120:397-1182(-)
MLCTISCLTYSSSPILPLALSCMICWNSVFARWQRDSQYHKSTSTCAARMLRTRTKMKIVITCAQIHQYAVGISQVGYANVSAIAAHRSTANNTLKTSRTLRFVHLNICSWAGAARPDKITPIEGKFHDFASVGQSLSSNGLVPLTARASTTSTALSINSFLRNSAEPFFTPSSLSSKAAFTLLTRRTTGISRATPPAISFFASNSAMRMSTSTSSGVRSSPVDIWAISASKASSSACSSAAIAANCALIIAFLEGMGTTS